jgi:hypothetical protein
MLPVTRQGSGKPCSFEGRDELAVRVWRGKGDAPTSRDRSQNISIKRENHDRIDAYRLTVKNRYVSIYSSKNGRESEREDAARLRV